MKFALCILGVLALAACDKREPVAQPEPVPGSICYEGDHYVPCNEAIDPWGS